MKKQIGVALVILTLVFGVTSAYATGGGYDHCNKENNDQHKCQPKDMCPNLVGIQYKVPPELIVDEQGNCVPKPKDVCPNLEGVQTTVPEGKELKDGMCVDKPTPPTTPPPVTTTPPAPAPTPPKAEAPASPTPSPAPQPEAAPVVESQTTALK